MSAFCTSTSPFGLPLGMTSSTRTQLIVGIILKAFLCSCDDSTGSTMRKYRKGSDPDF
ncbi:hypothetical protein M378DRAFT_165724, partial [Amanita muscaria Koide BX008]